MHCVSAGDTATLMRLLDGLQAHGREQANPSPIAVCFEAGRDGFWLHRLQPESALEHCSAAEMRV